MLDSTGPLAAAAKLSFYLIAALTLAGGFYAVSARNLFRAALGLALALFGVAAIYLYLQAEFLAVVQLLVYVGAILTLLIFGVMLTTRIADPAAPRWNAQWAASGILAIAAAAGLIGAICQGHSEIWGRASSAALTTVHTLGRVLFSVYLLPFELLSLLLLGALVGAIVIARKEKEPG